MQAKVVQSQTYSGDLDYITMPLSKDQGRGKIIMPATKPIMKEKARRQVIKHIGAASNKPITTETTPTGYIHDQDNYLQMTSSDSDEKESPAREETKQLKRPRKKFKQRKPDHDLLDESLLDKANQSEIFKQSKVAAVPNLRIDRYTFGGEDDIVQSSPSNASLNEGRRTKNIFT